MKKTLILLLLMGSTNVFAWSVFGPSNYGDCVLLNIKGAQNREAVFAVKSACKSKFPLEPCEEFNNMPNSGLTLSSARQLKETEGLSDDEIISHVQSAGIDVEKMIVEKKCNESRKLKK